MGFKKFIIGLLLTFVFQLSNSQYIEVLNFEQFEPHLHFENDTLYLINFWATWCAPCVEELPYIQQIAKKYSSEKFKVILVSLDFPSQLETRLKPFIEKHDIQQKVILLDDPNQNKWINKVSQDWSGSIPATLVYNSKTRQFFEKPFTFEELEKIVKPKL